VRLQVVADQAGSKHTGDSRDRGKRGQPVWPITTPDRRGHGDAHLWRIARAWQRAGPVSLSFARVIASLAGGGSSSDLAPSPRVDGLDVQAGPVDELLDVSVERPAVDQLEVKVGRTLEDRFLSALTGDHWEERHLDSVD
jgi:hypothetical protein